MKDMSYQVFVVYAYAIVALILLSAPFISRRLSVLPQLMTQIMKEYPAELTVVFFYNLSVSIIAAVVALITEGTSSVWIVRPSIALTSIICSGLFGSCLNNIIRTWALHLKGPFFVAMFKPLSIAIAVAMGVRFLGDTLHLGSLIGATTISMGFYTVMWGKAKEDGGQDSGSGSSECPSSHKAPLLHCYESEV